MSLVAPCEPPGAVDGGLPGPLRFVRYAYGPNLLGYCGPDAAEELRGYASSGRIEPRLRELAAAFEGAYPYLERIAQATGLPDPLDTRVVEAYWLGGSLHDAASVDGRRPVHAAHVLGIVSRFAGHGTAALGELLTVVDSCRIRWGTVEAVDGSRLEVIGSRLEARNGRLALGSARHETVDCWPSAAGERSPQPGEIVSLHWGWACERLSVGQLAALSRSTRHELETVNRAL